MHWYLSEPSGAALQDVSVDRVFGLAHRSAPSLPIHIVDRRRLATGQTMRARADAIAAPISAMVMLEI
jgi:hypothetical protein